MPLGFDSAGLFLLLSRIITAGGLLGSAIWIGHLIHLIRHRGQAIFLADLDASPPPSEPDDPTWSSVALIFAARDEAEGIEAAVRSMLAETENDPQLRLVAVDDRSSDGTGAILDRLSAADPQLAIIHVHDLPEGWLGKTHALQVGSDSPGGLDARWLLFTDADVLFSPGAIRRAVAYAEMVPADFVVVGPEVMTRSTGERMFLCLFGLLFSLYCPLGRVGDRRRRVHVGVGAFNLVRAEAFRAVGGFRHLALSVDDDMRLGQTMKYAGYTPRLLFGRGAVAVRWQVGTWGMIRGIQKNFFAGLKFRFSRVLLAIAGIVITGVAPFAALFIGPSWSRIVAGLGIGAVMTILAGSGRQSRIGWYYALCLPIASVLILVALGRSVILTLVNGGVNWRNHHYPLALLKAHARQRDAWLAEVWRSTR